MCFRFCLLHIDKEEVHIQDDAENEKDSGWIKYPLLVAVYSEALVRLNAGGFQLAETVDSPQSFDIDDDHCIHGKERCKVTLRDLSRTLHFILLFVFHNSCAQ